MYGLARDFGGEPSRNYGQRSESDDELEGEKKSVAGDYGRDQVVRFVYVSGHRKGALVVWARERMHSTTDTVPRPCSVPGCLQGLPVTQARQPSQSSQSVKRSLDSCPAVSLPTTGCCSEQFVSPSSDPWNQFCFLHSSFSVSAPHVSPKYDIICIPVAVHS